MYRHALQRHDSLTFLNEIDFSTSSDLAAVCDILTNNLVLSDMWDEIWEDDHLDKMFQYLIDPQLLICICFIKDGSFRVEFEIPEEPLTEFFYFIKKTTERVTTANYEDLMQYGLTRAPFYDNFYKIVHTIFAPMFLEESHWSDCVKSILPTQLSQLLAKLYKIKNYLRKRIVFYIPMKALEMPVHAASENREVVARIEGVVKQWLQVGKQVLTTDGYEDSDKAGPMEELAFWEEKNINLADVTTQLRSSDVEKCLQILQSVKSSFVFHFDLFYANVKYQKVLADENIKFLTVLKNPCRLLAESVSLDHMVRYMTMIVNTIRIIHQKSKYFSDIKKLHTLLNQVNNVLMKVICKVVTVDRVLNDMSYVNDAVFKNTIHYLTTWKNSYLLSEKAHAEHSSSFQWSIDSDIFLAPVNAFIGRCENFITINKYKRKFCAVNIDKKELLGNYIRGDKRKGVQSLIQSAEKSFMEILKSLRDDKEHALNVRTVTWTNIFSIFERKVLNLELFVVKSLSSSLEGISIVAEGMEILYLMDRFAEQQIARQIFNGYMQELLHIFFGDMRDFKMEMLKRSIPITYPQTKMGGIVYAASHELERIQGIYMSFEAASFLPETEYKVHVFAEYSHIADAFYEFSNSLNTKWCNALPKDIPHHFSKPILRYNALNSLALDINLNRNVVKLIQELLYWDKNHIEIQTELQPLQHRCAEYVRLLAKVRLIVQDYNGVMAELSKQHLELFQEKFHIVNRAVRRGLTRIMWPTHKGITGFYKECKLQCDKLRVMIENFKKSLSNIVNQCRTLSHQRLFMKDLDHPLHFDKFMQMQQMFRQEEQKNIMGPYLRIKKIMNSLYLLFEGDGTDVIPSQKLLFSQINTMLKTAVQEVFEASVEDMCSLFGPARAHRTKAILIIDLTLRDRKTTFSPCMSELEDALVDIAECIYKMLSELTVLKGYETDKSDSLLPYDKVETTIHKFRNVIKHSLTELAFLLSQYLCIWAPYNDLWINSKSNVLRFYQVENWTSEDFEKDIERFLACSHEVWSVKRYKAVEFIIVDCLQLQQAAQACGQEWRVELGSILKEIALRNLENIVNFLYVANARFHNEPKTIDELKHSINFLKKAIAISKRIRPTVVPMYQNFRVLRKFDLIESQQTYDKLFSLKNEWLALESNFGKQHRQLQKIQAFLQRNFVQFGSELKNRAELLVEHFHVHGPFQYTSDYMYNFSLLASYQKCFKDLIYKENRMKEDAAFFNITVQPVEALDVIQKLVGDAVEAWNCVKDYVTFINGWDKAHVFEIEIPSKQPIIEKYQKQILKLKTKVNDKKWVLLDQLHNLFSSFVPFFEVIESLQNETLQTRHWDEIKTILNQDFPPESSKFTLSYIRRCTVPRIHDDIEAISLRATNEYSIQLNIKDIRVQWEKLNIETRDYKDLYKLRNLEDLSAILEENEANIAAIKCSKYVGFFAEEVDELETALFQMQEMLELSQSFQKRFFFLENIFIGESIRSQLPKETADFEEVRKKWKDITIFMHDEKNVVNISQKTNLVMELNTLSSSLEAVQSSIECYLETKRLAFPRFYFVSNEDLLSILGQSQNPLAVEPHLNKCFDSIVKLEIGTTPEIAGYVICGMYSEDGEFVSFDEKIPLTGSAETWLAEVERLMKETLHDAAPKSLEHLELLIEKDELQAFDAWIDIWAGQVGLLAILVYFTADVTNSIKSVQDVGSLKPLKSCRSRWKSLLNRVTEAAALEHSSCPDKHMNLILTFIHGRDILDYVIRNNVNHLEELEWMKQLRYYFLPTGGECVVRQTTAQFDYGYEYLGNRRRLVITPLTDRCYLTLTTALYLHQGVCLKGPSGCGKTETVKDLGKGLGCLTLILNCSEGLDFKSLGRMLSGLAQIGAWCSFDEFNKINVEVLSVVAQQILCIFAALKTQKKKFIFMGNEIPLKPTCGIFITVNPAFYVGRSELPFNLIYMFRPLSLIVPDITIVSDILLNAHTFSESKLLAQKIKVMLELASQQMSQQIHYDFGLRAVMQILKWAIRAKQSKVDLNDEEIVYDAINEVTIPKLYSSDVPIFKGIMTDVFGDIRIAPKQYEELTAAIQEYLQRAGLQPSPTTITKAIQLHETKIFHHAIIVIGDTGSGKSTTLDVLKNAYGILSEQSDSGVLPVHTSVFNPKTVTLSEVYGRLDLETLNWVDGILPSMVRTACNDKKPIENWLILDGPADNQWVECMNSLMDDNKVLTLVNGERIVLSPRVTLIFEVTELSQCSPATVSRCGIIYHDYSTLGWEPYFETWLQKLPEKVPVKELKILSQKLLKPMLLFKRETQFEFLRVTELNAVMSFCKLMESFLKVKNFFDEDMTQIEQMRYMEALFIFALVWSVGGNANEAGREKVNSFLIDIGVGIPTTGSIYDYFVDKKKIWVLWETLCQDQGMSFEASMNMTDFLIPTKDTLCYSFVTSALLNSGHHVLYVGPVGSGKTLLANDIKKSLNDYIYTWYSINLSVQTTSMILQNEIESRFQKKSRGVYIPLSRSKLVLFLDDFNMPAKDQFGVQPALELIRMWMDYGFWYERGKVATKQLLNTILFAAMGPPGGSRKEISPQIQNQFYMLNIIYPQDAELFRIFRGIIHSKFGETSKDIYTFSSAAARTILKTYTFVASTFLPTPKKIHYLFSLRDIAKVVQGLLNIDSSFYDSSLKVAKAVSHECERVFSDRLVDDSDRKVFLEILDAQLNLNFKLSCKDLNSSGEIPLIVNILPPVKIYKEVTDLEAVKNLLLRTMNEINDTATTPLNLVMFKMAILHACRLARGIQNVNGNMLLMGAVSSGRKSLCQLVSRMLDYDLHKLEIRKNYGIEDFREDLKKLLKNVAITRKHTVFFLSEVHLVDDLMMQCLNDIVVSGDVSGLFQPDDWEEIFSEMPTDTTGTSKDELYKIFTTNVKTFLHVVLCLNGASAKFREYILSFPAIANYSSLDWYEDWPSEVLITIASGYLANTDVGQPLETRRNAIAQIFAAVHGNVVTTAKKMMKTLNRQVVISSAHYLNFTRNYRGLLTTKSASMRDAIFRLESGLKKIEETQDKVDIMAMELRKAQEVVMNFQKECDAALLFISEQKKIADKQHELVEEQRIEIEVEEAECLVLAEAAEKDLLAALPLLEEAKKALESLDKSDVGEIKSYPKPPRLVEVVLESVMILRESEPSWGEAKRQLGNPFFLKELLEFDKDGITDSSLQKVRKYVQKPEFKPDIVGKVSKAAKSLCMWVRAMYSYGCVYRMVEPKRLRLEAAKEALRIQQEQLAEALRKLSELNEQIIQLKLHYEEKLRHRQELFEEEQRLKAKLQRAAELVDGLQSEKIRWEKKVLMLNQKLTFIFGDCIIAVACLAYLGPFVSSFRETMIATWIKSINSNNIACGEVFDLIDYLSSENIVSAWIQQGLPNDHYSIENAVIITESHRWPLIIDPQEQAVKWIKKMEQGLIIVDSQDPVYIKALELCLCLGRAIMLENVSVQIDPVLDTLLTKRFTRFEFIRFGSQTLEVNPNFKMYLVTKVKNPEFSPDVANKMCVVNFAIKEKGLEDQLLSIVVKKERPDLEEQKQQLVDVITAGKEKLLELEELVLKLLNEAEGNILENTELVDTLTRSKNTSLEIEERLTKSQTTEKSIDSSREHYRPCARRASVLFFALDDMSSVDSMYLFSLNPYIDLFVSSIDNAKTDTNVNLRIEFIIQHHTYAVYKFSCRAMFEKHKLLLSFHMCTKILEAAGTLNVDEYDFFLRGGIVYDRSEQPPNPCPQWLSPESWDNITTMEFLPKFLDLSLSFDENARFWHEWYMNPEPEKVLLPGKWRNICNEFQKMLFVRCLRPDRITACICLLITNNLGKIYLEPPVLDMADVLKDSTPKTPLLFVLSSGVDPLEYLISLANACEMTNRYFVLSLGQGQASLATNMLKEAKAQGNWIYMANCHILMSYMPTLEKLFAEMEAEALHPDFRLWLSSMPSPAFPVSILQKSVKVTIETPKGIKSNLRKLYSTVNNDGLFDLCEKQTKYHKLLFSLSFFHSILIERRKFQNLGWNVVYEFNESDFKMSEQILRVYLDMYEETPWEALRELIMNINYGGHITDIHDVYLLDAYYDQFFVEEILTTPGYPMSPAGIYCLPPDGSLSSYIDYIETFPQDEEAEVFGQNANAEISYRVQEALFLFDNLLKAQPSKVTTEKKSLENTVLDVIDNIFLEVPESINQSAAEKLLKNDTSPYHAVLIQEVRNYNYLINMVQTSLTQLQHGLLGKQIMSPATEDLFVTIQNSHVPKSWLTVYPSMKMLGSYITDLKLRVMQIVEWVESGDRPVKFWLSGFTKPKAMLNATLQMASRQGDILIHDLKWEFIVSPLEEAHITEYPEDGIYVRGLFLEGAGFDQKKTLLTEPAFMSLVCHMPVIHFKPVHDVNTRGMYHCPCYYIPKRSYNGLSMYVMSVDLKSRKNEEYWVKRGTALLMSEM